MTTEQQPVQPADALENQGALFVCLFCRCVTPEGRAHVAIEDNGRCVCDDCWWRIAPPSDPTGPEDLARALALVADMPDVPEAAARPRPEAVRRPYRAARPRQTYWRWSQW